MLRVISASLVAGFALLGVMGTDATPAYRQAGIMLLPQAAERALTPGGRYALKIDAALIADPLPDSHPLSELPAGTQVILLAAAAPDFALVRDSDGRTGYVARTALAARQP